MAAGDPIKIALSTAEFLLTAETGVIIQGQDRSVDSKLKEVFNGALGYTIGYVFYDFVATQDFSAVVNGTTGLAAAAVGVVLTFATDLGIASAKQGVATGGCYVRSTRVSHQAEDLRMISGSTIQRHGIA